LPEPINFFPELISRLIPFFGWFQLMWAAEFALKFAVLIRGRWNLATRALEVVLAFVGLAVTIVVTQSIVSTLPSGIAPLDQLITISLVVTLVIIMVDAFVKLYRLFRPQARLPWSRDVGTGARDIAKKSATISKRVAGRFKKRD
jgi:hypothetical protein